MAVEFFNADGITAIATCAYVVLTAVIAFYAFDARRHEKSEKIFNELKDRLLRTIELVNLSAENKWKSANEICADFEQLFNKITDTHQKLLRAHLVDFGRQFDESLGRQGIVFKIADEAHHCPKEYPNLRALQQLIFKIIAE